MIELLGLVDSGLYKRIAIVLFSATSLGLRCATAVRTKKLANRCMITDEQGFQQRWTSPTIWGYAQTFAMIVPRLSVQYNCRHNCR